MAERSQILPPPEHLFVYGTLRPGQSAFEKFCREALTVDPAVASGSLYVLPAGYPVILLTESVSEPPTRHRPGSVRGDVVSFSDMQTQLGLLDAYEEVGGARSEYVRTIIDVRLLESGKMLRAWTYACPPEEAVALAGKARLLSSGDWIDR